MRGALKLGVPIAAGLATGGYALSQGEDPGSAALAAGTGALGGAAGLLGARQLAGKYNPALLMKAQKGLADAEEAAIQYALKSREGGVRQTAGNLAADVTRSLNKTAFGTEFQCWITIPYAKCSKEHWQRHCRCCRTRRCTYRRTWRCSTWRYSWCHGSSRLPTRWCN
jgi:hypothetical protein